MLTDLSNQLADAVNAVAPSVVQVLGRRRAATGLVYAPHVVLTTTQALGREEGFRVRGDDGIASDAELAGWDPASGIAVLRAPSLNSPATTISNARVRVGHLGVALARSWSNAITASTGNVATIGGPLRTGRRRSIERVYRITAPVHEGFAGGAFIDATGGLAGITTATSIRGFAVVIPAAIAWSAADRLLEHGQVKRGYLGIAGQPVTLSEPQRGAAGREEALLVSAVTSGGPAAGAGVLVGDIVLSVDDAQVTSPEDLLDLLMAKGAGARVSLQLLRGVSPVVIAVTAGERTP
jgi:S1-C subfamily serine protease